MAALGPLILTDALDLRVTTDTVSVFSTYGLTDNVDVAVAVPINRVAVDASLDSSERTLAGSSSPLLGAAVFDSKIGYRGCRGPSKVQRS